MATPSTFLRWILALCLLASCVTAQQRNGLEQARERWHQMSPAERARITKRFDEYRGLSETERQRVQSHLRRVAEARREIEARITPELRAKLERLGPDERRQVLREYVESAMSERAERLREKLPAEFLRDLEGADPARREELLRARREEWRAGSAPRVLEHLGRELELPPEELARLQALPPAEMMAAVAELGRRVIERSGPPPGVDPEEFRAWLELPPKELMERMHCHGMRGRPGERGARDGDRGPRKDGRPDGPRPPRRETRLTPEMQSQVLRALRPEKEWILELAEEPRERRMEEIGRRVHAKVIELLRNEPAVPPEELAALESAKGKEFFSALRQIIGDPPQRFGERFRNGFRGGAPERPPGAGAGDPGGERKSRERPRD